MDRTVGTNDGESNKENDREDVVQVTTRNQNETLPGKLMYQNIRRLVTKDNKEKVKFFEEYTKRENILIMNFTETWADENNTRGFTNRRIQFT